MFHICPPIAALCCKYSKGRTLLKLGPLAFQRTLEYEKSVSTGSMSRDRKCISCPAKLCDLPLKAARGVTIAVVSSRERKRRQPGLATDDPAFVGWHHLVRSIQGSDVHFDFV